MVIIHHIDDVIFELFPRAKQFGNSIDILLEEISDYYTYKIYKPTIEIKDKDIYITLEFEKFLKEEKDWFNAVSLCEKGKLKDAKQILDVLINNNPTNSEYHRIYGQILSDEGDNEGAINCLIDSVKWDSRNKNAFIMLGNIYTKIRNDIDTAIDFYNKALEIDPNDYIAVNNIGANLIIAENFKEAERYFEYSYSINKDYPNTLAGLSKISFVKSDFLKAFDYAILGLKKSKVNDPIYNHCFELLNDSTNKYLQENSSEKIYLNFADELEKQSKKGIIFIEDNNSKQPSNIEIAEYSNAKQHVVKYKMNRKGIVHLIMHELCHLKLVFDARKANNNYLFTLQEHHKINFENDTESFKRKLKMNDYSDEAIAELNNHLYKGLNMQIFNNPIDLYIEDYLYNTFPELRPIQFISLLELYQDYLKSIKLNQNNQLIPKFVTDTNTILIMVQLLQYQDLFGMDLMAGLKVNYNHKKIAKELFDEWYEKRNSNTGGLEYQLIKDWSKKLKLDNYFELLPEQIESISMNDIFEVMEKIKTDPYNFQDKEAIEQNSKQNEFSESADGTMTITLYCIDALDTFRGKTEEFIKEVGFEIATLGRYGLDTTNHQQKFNLHTIPNKKFSALQLLTFMYVAFQKINHTMDLGFDFKEEYLLAMKMTGDDH